jgi:hypothetical protein
MTSLDPHDRIDIAVPHKELAPNEPRKSKRPAIVGSIVIASCAVACSIPLIAGAGALGITAGLVGGAVAWIAVGVAVAVAAWGLWRRRSASRLQAASVKADAAPDACSVDRSCAGSGCGCA